jgi:site-specific recombinase XerD
MFDQLFERPAAVRRHLNSPLVEERLEYLRYRAGQGYKRRTLRELAQDLLRIQNLLGLSASSESFDAAAVEAAVKRCVPRRKPHSSCKNWHQKEVFYHAIHWLRFLKRLRLPSVAPPIYQPLKKNFVDYLRVEKGLSAETLRTRCGHVEDFLQWFFRNHKSLRQLTIALAAPNLQSAQGRRDHLLLLFLYNTGARADEAAQVLIGDLHLAHVPSRDLSWVRVRGKGNKLRHCPLWPQTVNELIHAIEGRGPAEHVFLNRYRRPITRFGVYDLVKRYVQKVLREVPSLAMKNVSPHTIRHSSATHLLRGGVDINTIRDWLGHVSVDTTNIYASVDLETKAKAITHCEPGAAKPARRWEKDKKAHDLPPESLTLDELCGVRPVESHASSCNRV